MYYLQLQVCRANERVSWLYATKSIKKYEDNLVTSKCYKITEELYNMVYRWGTMDTEYDGQLSGVIADFIEDRLSIDKYLADLVIFLRKRFMSEKHNRLFDTV